MFKSGGRSKVDYNDTSNNSGDDTSDTDNALEEAAVPDGHVVGRLRATLVESGVPPKIQRLLIERQVQRNWNCRSKKTESRVAVAVPALGKKGKNELKSSSSIEGTSSSKLQQDPFACQERFAATAQDERPLDGRTAPLSKLLPTQDLRDADIENADASDEFWPWLQNILMQRVPYLECLLGEKAHLAD